MGAQVAKILVVDDEPDVQVLFRARFRRELRRGELDLTFAGDGVEALDRVMEDPDIEIVVTDINMPRMNGLQLLAELQGLGRVLQTVVMSAYGDIDNVRAAMNRGAFDFLMKPIEFDDLRATLAKTLRQVTEQREGRRAREDARLLQERNEFILGTFSRYVSESVVDSLLESPEALELGGVRREITVMMADIRGFTALSERLAPEDVVDILNRYLSAVIDVVMSHDGTLIEIMGDGLLVMFGAPQERPDDAARALRCAVAMQQAVHDLNADLAADGIPSLEVGIGLNTGPAVVGNVGSEKRTKYCAVGAHVNLACRIEGYTVGGQVLASDSTMAAAGGIGETRDRVTVRSKGVQGEVGVHDVVGVDGEHGLRIPAALDEPLLELEPPVAVRYVVLEGKDASGDVETASLVGLSASTGLIRFPSPVATLDNVRLWVPFDGRDVEAYAKVVSGNGHADGSSTVRFTSRPPEVVAWIDTVLAGDKDGARPLEPTGRMSG